MDLQSLSNWFKQYKRALPWRESHSPYHVWVSEVMLQQTQANVVIPYYHKFLKLFPSVEALAKAGIEEVIKAWEGLGYYSRARNLHKGAQYIVEHFKGKLPSSKEELLKIPGIGAYTAGAILSFAFHKKAAAVDGNVIRVITRLFGITEDVQKPAAQKKIYQLVEKILPEKEPWIASEALIELGATVCKKAPLCNSCPLQKQCKAFQQGLTEKLPYKGKKTTITPLYRAVAVIQAGNEILIRKVPEGKIMAGLHEFPYFETTEEGISDEELEEKVNSSLKLSSRALDPLPQVSHSFTRYAVTLSPHLLVARKKAVPGHFWVSKENLHALPFSSGHRKIREMMKDEG